MWESLLAATAAVLILGSAWFWAVTIGLFFLILVLEETDRYFFAGLSVLAFVFVMEQSGAISIFTSPLVVLKWGAVYMVVGAAWSFVKWFSYLHQRSDTLKKLKLRWLKERNAEVTRNDAELADVLDLLPVVVGTKIPKGELSNYRDFLTAEGYLGRQNYGSTSVIPKISDNKAKVTGWMIWWPWSALWTIFNDPIRRLANAIYNQLQDVYQALADRVFAKFEIEDEG